jgi:hypothetical protein
MSVIVFAGGLDWKLASRFMLGPVSFVAITVVFIANEFINSLRGEEVSKIF